MKARDDAPIRIAATYPIPTDWEFYDTVKVRVGEVCRAALLEVGGSMDSKQRIARGPDFATVYKAFRLGLEACGVPYEMVDRWEYHRRLDEEWQGSTWAVHA